MLQDGFNCITGPTIRCAIAQRIVGCSIWWAAVATPQRMAPSDYIPRQPRRVASLPGCWVNQQVAGLLGCQVAGLMGYGCRVAALPASGQV